MDGPQAAQKALRLCLVRGRGSWASLVSRAMRHAMRRVEEAEAEAEATTILTKMFSNTPI